MTPWGERSAIEVEGETRNRRRSSREGGEGGGASIAGGGAKRVEKGEEGEVSACLPAAVSCVQCVFKHGTSVRPRKACNAAQPSLSPTPETHRPCLAAR